MDWKVENALSRDVERQQLNKILKDVRAAIDAANKTIASNTNADIKTIVGQMFTGNTEVGVSAVYNAVKKVIDLSVPNFFIRLQGDVEGVGQVNALGDVTIVTSLAEGVGGVEEAPTDGQPYWRKSEDWEAVPVPVQSLATLPGNGILVLTSDNTIEARTLETGDGIDILIPDGDTGDPEISFNADTGEVAFLPGATYQTVQKFVDVMHSPGIITGGEITDLGSGNVRVAAGTMMVRIADDDVSTLAFANFAQTDFAVPNDQTTRFFGVVYNAGSPIVEMRTVFDWDKDTEIPLGSATRLTTTITGTVPNKYRTGDPVTNLIQRLDAVAPAQRDNSIGGLALGEAGTRNVTLTAGRIWSRLVDFDVVAKNSSTDAMLSVYFNGTNLTFTDGLTQWDNVQYNDLGTGTLVTIANNKYANLWFFIGIDGTRYGFAYGTQEHNTLGDAANEGLPPYLTQNFFNQSVLLGRFIFQESAATASSIESAFTVPLTTAAINTHNDLGGLQGGTVGEFYHLTAAELADVQSIPGIVIDSIADGDTTHAPSRNSVFDALVLKQPLDATLTALAGENWALGSFPIGTGTDTVMQTAFPKGYIDGLQMQWVSGTAITVTTGSAYIEGSNRPISVTSAIAKVGLSLSASTFYHVYLFLNSGAPDIEIVTTAPASAYSGTARSKTGDTSRRYVGSIRTGTSSGILNFHHDQGHGLIKYAEDLNNNQLRVLTGGLATTATNVSMQTCVPVTGRVVEIFATTGAGDLAFVSNPDLTSDPTTLILFFAQAEKQVFGSLLLSSDQHFNYLLGPATTGLTVYCSGYFYER